MIGIFYSTSELIPFYISFGSMTCTGTFLGHTKIIRSESVIITKDYVLLIYCVYTPTCLHLRCILLNCLFYLICLFLSSSRLVALLLYWFLLDFRLGIEQKQTVLD